MDDHLLAGNHSDLGAQNSRLGEEAAAREYHSILVVSVDEKPIDHTGDAKEGAGSTGYDIMEGNDLY
jgi:hypothetical protein